MDNLYVCDPQKNINCKKISCQKECFHTHEEVFSKDNVNEWPDEVVYKIYGNDDLTQLPKLILIQIIKYLKTKVVDN